jgi:predicted phosphoadenosine phosphosulfate sulfurtransferase
MFTKFMEVEYPGKACYIAGVRAEESMARYNGLTSYATYKGVTWGNACGKKNSQYTFYPIYDWVYTDVWKAIHDNSWSYCALYDYFYQYGVPVRNMRVSNVHHETAIHQLFFLQEIESETWNTITQRISGINSAGQLQKNAFFPRQLPYMFSNWWEYRDYLLENMITNIENKEKMKKTFAAADKIYHESVQLDLVKTQIAAILVNDYHGTKMTNFIASHGKYSKNAHTRGKI